MEIQPENHSKHVIAFLGTKILIKKQDLPVKVIDAIKHHLSFDNPEYFKDMRGQRKNANTPRKLYCFDEDSSTLQFPKGFASTLIDIFHQHRIGFEFCENTPQFPEEPFEFHELLFDYQQRAIKKMGNRRYGILVAPTGCGKKIVALYLIHKRKLPALVIVRSKYRFNQWREIVRRVLGIGGDDIGLIGDGHQRIGKKITIAIDRSLYHHVDELKERIGFIIVDQCDTANPKFFFNAVDPIASRYVLGLSRHPQRSDGLTDFMLAHIGPVLHTTENVCSPGIITSGNQMYKIHRSPFSFKFEDNYSDMISSLCNDAKRNQLIAGDILFEASQAKSKVWVISESLEHLQTLQGLLAPFYQNLVGIITGKTPDKARVRICDQFQKGKLKVIMTTLKSVETSKMNDVNVLMVASPFKYGFPLIMATSALRGDKIKGAPMIYDYADQPEILKISLKQRVRGYRRLGYREETLSPDIVH